jgi:predicted membrane channel-forming protein YqfA (hemolysin III family)
MLVTAVSAIAIGLYVQLGFIVTMTVMMVALLLIVERQNPIRAVAYSLGIVLLTYGCFVYGLKTPLPEFSF